MVDDFSYRCIPFQNKLVSTVLNILSQMKNVFFYKDILFYF